MRQLLSAYFDPPESLVLNDSQRGTPETLERVRRTVAEHEIQGGREILKKV